MNVIQTMLPDFSRDFATIADFLDWWLRHDVLAEPHASVFNGYYQGYRKHFGPHVRHHYSDQSRELVELIEARPGARLLEVGGGCGTEAIWFALKGAKVLAVDVNAERLDVARARQAIVEEGIGRKLDLEFRLCSLFDLEGESLFDLVWMEQAFHHVEPREQVYPTLARLVSPGGHVVISEANGWNPLLQLVLFRRRGFTMIVDRIAPDGTRILYGNERITIPSILSRGFAGAGFEQQAVRYFRALPNAAISDRLMGVERAIPGFAAPLFSHYNYVGRRTGTP